MNVIVVGIPAYNEEKTISRVILLAQKHVDKVIVCDDGSTDFTAEIAQKLGAIVISHKKNLGYGEALQTLFQKAQMMKVDFLVTLDADGQHDPREIPKLIHTLRNSEADIVIGSRFLEKSNNIPSYRKFGIKLLTKVTKGYGESNLSDAQCGFRAYNRKAIETLLIREGGMGASAEILLEARNHDLRVVEIPVRTYYQGLDTSTHNPLKHGLGVFATIIKLVVEENPLLYLGIPGAAALVVGTFFGLWTLQLYTVGGRIVTNVALASVAFILIGLFAIFTAITLYAILRATVRQQAKVNKKQIREDNTELGSS